MTADEKVEALSATIRKVEAALEKNNIPRSAAMIEALNTLRGLRSMIVEKATLPRFHLPRLH